MHWKVIKEIISDSRLYTSYGAEKSVIDQWTKEQMAFAITDLWAYISLYKKALVENLENDPLKDVKIP